LQSPAARRRAYGSREEPMEMRIVVPDAAGASDLADRLTIALGSGSISLGGECREVDVSIEGEPDPAIVCVVDAVESWFGQARVGDIEMWLGERSYRLAQWVPAEAWR
jgi:hypothetical protein